MVPTSFPVYDRTVPYLKLHASVIYSARESTFKNEVIYLAPKSLTGVVEAYWRIKVYPRTDWFSGFYVFSINLLHC